MNYDTYIQSQEWKDKKRLRLEKDNFKCQDCGCSGVVLDVHHITYKRLFDEDIFDLITLCRSCHIDVHTRIGDTDTAMKMLNPSESDVIKREGTQRILTREEIIKQLVAE